VPWASKAQARWGHSPSGVKALGGKAKVSEWDAATPKGSLKARAKKPKNVPTMKLSMLLRAK
jgi:hypothetical protein